VQTNRFISARLGPVVLLACAAAAGVTGVATAQDQVSGTFTVKGDTTKFAYAYVYWKPNFFDETRKDLFVLFSDVALPANAIPKDDDGISAIAGLVREGKVHALELHLDPRSRQLDAAENAAVYHQVLSPGRHGMSGMHAFTAKTFTTSLLEGTAHTDGPQESDGVKWEYDVRFKVTLPPM
jgi:hypothetical protein